MPQAAEVWPLVAMNCCLRSVTPVTPVTATVSDSTTLEADMYINVHLLTIINAQSSRHWHVFSNFLNLSGAVVTCCAEICRPNVFNWKSICWNHICNWPILTHTDPYWPILTHTDPYWPSTYASQAMASQLSRLRWSSIAEGTCLSIPIVCLCLVAWHAMAWGLETQPTYLVWTCCWLPVQ